MLKNENIICISSIDWDFIWQGHQEIMAQFARNGNRVLFIENTGVRAPNFKDFGRLKKRVVSWFKSIRGFRKELENLYVYSPVILPFPYSRIARWLNRRIFIKPIKNWMRVMGFRDPIFWTFLPTGTALDIVNNIDKKLLVYYCIADFYELAGSFKKVKRTEDELIKKSDVIFAQGGALGEKCRQLNTNVQIFPFGVKLEAFDDFRYNPAGIPEDIRNIKKPIIGYIGGIHRHIDFGLLRFIANNHPEWSIVLIGPLQTDAQEINDLKNVFLLGKKEFSHLPAYIDEFNVCLIPYLKSQYTATVYPTKLNEYHALGKPVVSTDLPEVINFNQENDNLILVARNYDEFLNSIVKALPESDASLIAKRKASAQKNSWTARIQQMSSLMEEAIARKANMSPNWQESFLKLYRAGRRRILKLAFVFSAIYIILFYTPLIWLLANPLKIAQAPRKADCIVVFAGGTGESGRAGQGYEERVQYAADLYKRGYAAKIIFSSGYMYFFKEPLVMKALAVSLGVPPETILLEDKAGNTYQNVRLTYEILQRNGYKDILLVSSPYHMRRSSLIFKKIAKDIRVIYTPIPESLFYAHSNGDVSGWIIYRRINLRQIKGIFHEYLAILYYWIKGRI